MSHILIGISGGIAAYKTQELIRLCVKSGNDVKVILTPAATEFVTPTTIRTLSQNPVYTDTMGDLDYDIAHIELIKWADIFVIAPATANTIAKIAHGIADNLLTSSVLAYPQTKPLLIAPAMNTGMWGNPITQSNLAHITSFYCNAMIIPPRVSELACGDVGMGAMAEIADIEAAIHKKYHA